MSVPAACSKSESAAPHAARRITVAICTHNRARLLERAIRSLLPQVDNHSEILIVNNGSTDETADVAARFAATAPQMVCVQEPAPGLSAARNTALQRARGEYVIFLDDDAEAQPDWLAAYTSFFATLPSPRVAVAGGPVMPDYESPPPRWLDPREDSLDLGYSRRRVPAQGAGWGCNIAYHREAALRVGSFRSQLGRTGRGLGAHEETDLNLRLERAGYEAWWLPGARIRHRVARERLGFRWRWRSAFEAGRSRAVIRMSAMYPGGRRLLWALARLGLVPFHAALNLLLAPLTLVFQHGRLSAKAAFHAAGVLGMGCGLWTELGLGDNNSDKPA